MNCSYSSLTLQSSESFSAFFSPFFLLVARSAAATEVSSLLSSLVAVPPSSLFLPGRNSFLSSSVEAKISLLNAQLGGLRGWTSKPI